MVSYGFIGLAEVVLEPAGNHHFDENNPLATAADLPGNCKSSLNSSYSRTGSQSSQDIPNRDGQVINNYIQSIYIYIYVDIYFIDIISDS